MKKRSFKVDGHASSVSLEDEFYDYLKKQAAATGQTFADVVRTVQAKAGGKNLSRALRIHALEIATGDAR